MLSARLHLLVLAAAAAALCRAAPAELSLNTLTQGPFVVAHAPEDESHARAALAVLTEFAQSVAHRLPVGDAPVRVLVAPTAAEFQKHARSFLPGQVSGLARPSEGLMVVRPPTLRAGGGAGDFGTTLRHELVHILLARNVDDALMPNWLNEGVAMHLSREYQIASPVAVAQMFLEGRIIPYRDLDMAFMTPGEEREFNDAYAQALSMTRHLHRRLGEEGFWALVLALRDMPFPDALHRHAGMTVAEFWDGYHRSLWYVALIGVLASGSFFTPAAFLVIIVWFRKRRRDREVLDQWEREEAAGRRHREPVLSWEEALDDETTYVPGIDDEEDEEW